MKLKVKNIILFSALSIVWNTGITQEINFTKERLDYLSLINQAELYITDNNFEKAISYYDSAFTVVRNHRDIDKYNMALCYRKAGNDNKADSLFVLLAKKGFRSSYLYNCYDTVKFGKIKKEPVIINEKKLDEIFEGILNSDQKANSYRFTDMEKYALTLINNAKHIKTLSTEINNLLSFDYQGKLYFPIHNFLQLRGIAARVKSDSIFRKEYVVYKCLEDIDFEEIQFYEFMINEVAKGNFDNESFAGLMAIVEHWLGGPVTQYDEYIIVRSPDALCEDELEEIAKNREFFGLENYEDFYQKAWYTDSLITKGSPFTALGVDEYVELMTDFENQCTFNIAKDYRNMMDFTKPEDAQYMYEKGLKSLCPK